MRETEDFIDMEEETEHNWKQYLSEFDEKVWPLFEKHGGYSKGEAHLIWYFSKLTAQIETLNNQLSDPEEY